MLILLILLRFSLDGPRDAQPGDLRSPTSQRDPADGRHRAFSDVETEVSQYATESRSHSQGPGSSDGSVLSLV